MRNAPRILLVDDDRHVTRFLKKALEEDGYPVKAINTGSQAINSLEEPPPGLLILDLDMPQPDGFEVLKTARSKFPYLKILVISGYLRGALLEAATLLGATAALEKPIAPEALVAKVREVLGGRRMAD
jgi:CheY-like chemotaxis protein